MVRNQFAVLFALLSWNSMSEIEAKQEAAPPPPPPNMAVFSELVLPFEILVNEIFPVADEHTQFTFSWVCKYFAHKSRNSNVSYPFGEAMLVAVQTGSLGYLRYWFPGKARPYSVSMCNLAAFHGHINILEWLNGSASFPIDNPSLLLHAVFSRKVETVKFLTDLNCACSGAVLQVASARCGSPIVDLLRAKYPAIQVPNTGTVYGIPENSKLYLNLKSSNSELAQELLDTPHPALIKLLIEESSIFVGGSLLAGFALLQMWRLVKAICSLELPSGPNSRPVVSPTNVRGNWLKERIVDDNGTILSNNLTDFLGRAVSHSGRTDLLEWFIQRKYLSLNSVDLGALFRNHNYPILKTIINNSGAALNPVEILRLAVEFSDREFFKFLIKKDYMKHWATQHSEFLKNHYRDDLFEWLLLEAEALPLTDVRLRDIIVFGFTELAQKIFPAKIQRFNFNSRGLFNDFRHRFTGMWVTFFYALDVGAIDFASIEMDDFLKGVPPENVMSLIDRGFIKWDAEFAKKAGEMSRWDILLKAVEAGFKIELEVALLALNSGSTQIVKKLVQGGGLVWHSALTVHAAQNSFWDIVSLGLEQPCPNSQDELATMAMELVRGGKFVLLEDLFEKHGLVAETLNKVLPELQKFIAFGRAEMIAVLLRHGVKLEPEKIFEIARARGNPELLAEVSKSFPYDWTEDDVANYLTRKLYDGAQFAVTHSKNRAAALKQALVFLCKDKPELTSKAGERGIEFANHLLRDYKMKLEGETMNFEYEEETKTPEGTVVKDKKQGQFSLGYGLGHVRDYFSERYASLQRESELSKIAEADPTAKASKSPDKFLFVGEGNSAPVFLSVSPSTAKASDLAQHSKAPSPITSAKPLSPAAAPKPTFTFSNDAKPLDTSSLSNAFSTSLKIDSAAPAFKFDSPSASAQSPQSGFSFSEPQSTPTPATPSSPSFSFSFDSPSNLSPLTSTPSNSTKKPREKGKGAKEVAKQIDFDDPFNFSG